MAEEKNVAIVLRQAPHGTLYPVEGLRMSVALSGDMDPITVVMGDGIYAFLKTTDKKMYQMHYDFIKECDLDVFVDKKALDERGLTKDDILDTLEVKEHGEILKILTSVDTVIPF
jgi:sulfur relay (sulfurtransferase) DsrF/TusC family protein